MGKEIVYCTQCGDRIPAKDFDRGRAATVLARHFCHGCSESLALRTPPEERPRQSTASPLRKLSPRRSLLANLRRGAVPSRLPFLIVGAIGLIALAFICVLWSGSGAGHS